MAPLEERADHESRAQIRDLRAGERVEEHDRADLEETQRQHETAASPGQGLYCAKYYAAREVGGAAHG